MTLETPRPAGVDMDDLQFERAEFGAAPPAAELHRLPPADRRASTST